uniref:non-specific serine/threonine protein kinase n=1 Tax=Anopheles culicifacies TaxID=139723 RepID=A0A182LVC6_9DIPT
MGKRNAAAAIVDADRLPQFETPPKRMKHGPAATGAPTSTASPPADAEPSSPNISASEFTLSKEFVDGTLLMDLTLKQWRTGKPIGKGSFGEIFLASDDIGTPVTSENAKYVVKIEPHSNGPLFVEIHCLLNTAKRTETCIIPPGMPEYIASGSHMFKNERYRFLILKRYQRDLHSLIKNKRVNPKSIPVIACQILDVLEHLHDQGYVHSDIKAENLMIGTVEGTAQNGANRSSSGQNGTDYQSPEHRSNGVTLAEGKVAKRGTKASAEHHQVNGASGTNAQENGLYFHQEQEMCTRTRNLRPLKTVTYRDLSDEDERSANT